MTLSLMLVSFWGFGQQVTITGNIPFATVIVKDKDVVLFTGTTDFDGNYSIVASSGDILVSLAMLGLRVSQLLLVIP